MKLFCNYSILYMESLAFFSEYINNLSNLDKLRLITQISKSLEKVIKNEVGFEKKKDLYGILKNFGNAPSDSEIFEIRNELFGDFPRGDII